MTNAYIPHTLHNVCGQHVESLIYPSASAKVQATSDPERVSDIVGVDVNHYPL